MNTPSRSEQKLDSTLHAQAEPPPAGQPGHNADGTPPATVPGMNASAEHTQAVRAAIAESNRRFADAAARNDAGAMASVYASNADVVPPNAEPLRGTAAIQDFWHGGIEMGIKGLDFETVRLDEAQDVAYEIGRYTLHFGYEDGAPVTDEATYFLVHKRQQDGSWRRTAEFFTRSTPLT
jgi:uncharacterized protein (TIGR02246 family)